MSASIRPSQKPGIAKVNVVAIRSALSSHPFGRIAPAIASGTPISRLSRSE